jgi:hypothetical protein
MSKYNSNHNHGLHVRKHGRTECCVLTNESNAYVVRPIGEDAIFTGQDKTDLEFQVRLLRQVYIGQCPLSDVRCPKYPTPFVSFRNHIHCTQ